MSDDLTADIQRFADAEHARQPVCSWCGRPGVPYEHRGVTFDGLTACEGDRLCERCRDTYMLNTPLLVEDIVMTGEPPVQVIAAEYRYRDYQRPKRRSR